MAVDYFLKLDGIDGESVDPKHKGEIVLEAFTWSETNVSAPVPVGGGASSGKVTMGDLVVSMRTSKASPKLMLACASGEHLKTAVLTVRKAGKGQQDFLVFKLTDVVVSSYQVGGNVDGDAPTDSVALHFARIAVEYRAAGATGKLEAPVNAGWDVSANKRL